MKNKITVYLFILKLCWLSIFKLNLGDRVSYCGKSYNLVQGVNDPLWHLQNSEDRVEYVHKNDFTKHRSLRNVFHDLKCTWDFYIGYWSDIWIRDPSKMRSWP